MILVGSIIICSETINAATIQCDAFAGNYNTGSCRSNRKTQTSLVRGRDREDGWFKFDLSNIPAGSTINSVEFHGYVNDTYWPFWSITPVSIDPVTSAAAALYNAINQNATSGYYLYRDESAGFSSGWHNFTLGGNVAVNLQAALTQGWIAMGLVSRDDSRDYYIIFDGWNESNPPYLLVDCTIPSAVNDPASFSALPAASDQIDLAWTPNGNYDDVMVAFNTDNIWGIPVNGTTYAAGNSIAGGGTVLYVGSAAGFNHTSLSSPQTYYYTAWSIDGSSNYSSGIKANATTPVDAYPWTQDFDASAATPAEWTNNSIDPWLFSASADYGANTDVSGSGNFAWVDDSAPYENPSSLITPPFDLSSLNPPQLDFYYWIGTGDPGSTLAVDIFDGSNWTDDVLNLSYNGQWQQQSLILSAYASAATRIRFRALEQTDNFNCDICLDEITISAGPPDPVFAIDYESYNYGSLFTGLSAGQVFTISNMGGGELGITSISIGGTDYDQFTLNSPSSGSVSSGGTMPVEVLFSPTSAGSKSAALIISDDLGGNHNIPLSGNSVYATISSFPYRESFDGGSSAPTNWTNNSADPWQFSTSAQYGADQDHTGGGNFAWVDDSTPYENPHELITPPFDVTSLTYPQLEFYYWIGRGASGSVLNIDIFDGTNWNNSVVSFTAHNGWNAASVMLAAFSSEVLMIRFNALEQTDNYNCDICLDDVTIQEGPTDPLFFAAPLSHDFGTYNLGLSQPTQNFTIRNDGGGSLTINSVALGGIDAADFELNDLNSYPKILISGQSMNLEVSFDPADTGSKSAILSITDDQQRTVHDLPLSGTAVNYNSGGGAAANGFYYFANSLASPGPVYDWIDHSTHTLISTWTSGNSDDGYFQIPDLGFDFEFFGISYRTNDVFISTNGIITFGSGHSDYSQIASASIPATNAPNNMIAGCGMDLDAGADGLIYYNATDDNFVVTYYKYYDYGDDNEWITFQIILRSDGLIKIQYNEALSNLAPEINSNTILGDALIGIENSGGSAGIQYRNDGTGGPIFSSPLALAFSTNEGALPVTLSNFTTAVNSRQEIVISWTTHSESNLIGYKIFRSQSDLWNIEYISDLIPATNTSQTHNYEYHDSEIEVMVEYNYWLQSYELDGFSYLWGPASQMVFAAEPPALPLITELSGNYPNPFNPSTAIKFSLSKSAFTSLVIYNIKGQKIRTLVNEMLEMGYHHIVWDGKTDSGKSAASGIYLYQMRSGEYDSVKKMLLQK